MRPCSSGAAADRAAAVLRQPLRDGTSGSTDSSSGRQGGQQKRRREALKKDNQQASRYVHVTKDHVAGRPLDESAADPGRQYGWSASAAAMSISAARRVMLGMRKVMVQGELWSKNVYAMSGGGAEPPDRVAAATALERLMARVDELTARIEVLEARP